MFRPPHLDRRHRHPGFARGRRPLASGLSSPIDLRELPEANRNLDHTRSMKLLVRAPGHAWTFVELNPAVGGCPEVRLEPSASLSLRFRGRAAKRSLFLQLNDLDGLGTPCVLYTELPEGDRVELDGLLPGRYRLKLHDSDARFGGARDLEQDEIELVAGARAEVVWELAPPQTAFTCDLEGTVLVSAEWGLGSLSLQLAPGGWAGARGRVPLRANAEETATEGRREWRFRFPGVQSGTWRLSTEDPALGIDAEVEIGPDSCGPLEIDVPRPAFLTLHVLDEATGLAPATGKLHWKYADRTESPIQPVSTPEDRGPAANMLIAAARPIEIVWHDGRVHRLLERIDLRPGEQQATLRVPRSCGIVVRCFDGERQIRLPALSRTDVSTPGGERVIAPRSMPGLDYSIHVPEPGRYVLRVPRLVGYAEIGPITCDVAPGEYAEVRIDLVRE